jgi:hypothetical protein
MDSILVVNAGSSWLGARRTGSCAYRSLARADTPRRRAARAAQERDRACCGSWQGYPCGRHARAATDAHAGAATPVAASAPSGDQLAVVENAPFMGDSRNVVNGKMRSPHCRALIASDSSQAVCNPERPVRSFAETAQACCRNTHNAALRSNCWNRGSRHTASSWPSAV